MHRKTSENYAVINTTDTRKGVRRGRAIYPPDMDVSKLRMSSDNRLDTLMAGPAQSSPQPWQSEP